MCQADNITYNDKGDSYQNIFLKRRDIIKICSVNADNKQKCVACFAKWYLRVFRIPICLHVCILWRERSLRYWYTRNIRAILYIISITVSLDLCKSLPVFRSPTYIPVLLEIYLGLWDAQARARAGEWLQWQIHWMIAFGQNTVPSGFPLQGLLKIVNSKQLESWYCHNERSSPQPVLDNIIHK